MSLQHGLSAVNFGCSVELELGILKGLEDSGLCLSSL